MIENPEEFRAAISGEDFFPMIKEFPKAWWGSRLSLTVYRMEDDDGLMIKNGPGKPKKLRTWFQCVTDEDIAKTFGGGKYQVYLQLDSKTTLRQETFEMDKGAWGPPKVAPGQIVEIDGKPVQVGVAATSAAPERSDVAAGIEAATEAGKQGMELLTDATKQVVAMVRDQAAAAAPQKSSVGELTEIVTLVKALSPPHPQDSTATALAMLDKLDSIIARRNPKQAEAPEPVDPPIDRAIELLERVSGKDLADILKGGNRSNPAPEPTPPWLGIVLGVAEKFFAVAPQLMAQAASAREREFQRQVWLRTAQPGQAPPAQLAAPEPQPTAPAADPSAPPATLNPADLLGHVIQMVQHGFRNNPHSGAETAAALAFNFGPQLESTGLVREMADEANVGRLAAGHPALAPLATDARWPEFMHEFVEYMQDRYGIEPVTDETAQEPDKKGPQPVGA